MSEINRQIRIFNKLFSIVLFFLSSYLIVYPLFPEVSYALDNKDREVPVYNTPEVREQIKDGDIEISETELKPMPEDKVLVIPKIGVDGRIVQSDSANALNEGFWHRPNTSTPPDGGNTVISGHRFMYNSGPKTFYHLDKIEMGDEFSVFWDEKEYRYKVFKIQVVDPTGVQVEKNTKENIVTLYTCTPLWTAKQRLVIQAELIDSK